MPTSITTTPQRRSFIVYALASMWLIFAAAWIFSMFWSAGRNAPWVTFGLDDGVAYFSRRLGPPDPYIERANWYLTQEKSRTRYYGLVLPAAVTTSKSPNRAITLVIIPLWTPLLVLTLLLALMWLRRLRPGPPNACEHCEYDLFNNVSGTCPECGTTIPTVSTVVGKT